LSPTAFGNQSVLAYFANHPDFERRQILTYYGNKINDFLPVGIRFYLSASQQQQCSRRGKILLVLVPVLLKFDDGGKVVNIFRRCHDIFAGFSHDSWLVTALGSGNQSRRTSTKRKKERNEDIDL
jgi:hypothetical protein